MIDLTAGELEEQSRDVERAIEASALPSLETAGTVVLIRWQMVHAHELRRIRESLERLERRQQ